MLGPLREPKYGCILEEENPTVTLRLKKPVDIL
jgi:hypothetical protein